jgi:hypothetical protein
MTPVAMADAAIAKKTPERDESRFVSPYRSPCVETRPFGSPLSMRFVRESFKLRMPGFR